MTVQSKTDTNTTQRIKKPALPLPWLAALLGLMIGAAAGYWLYSKAVVAGSQEQLNALGQRQAQHYASQMNLVLNRWNQHLAQFSQNQTLVTALEQEGPAAWSNFTNRLQTQFTHVYSGEYFPLNSAQLRDDATNPLRFPELDMINRAQEQENVPPEASQINKDYVINLAAPVVGTKGRTIGTLFIRLSSAAIQEQLQKLDLTQGKIQIIQTFGRSSSVLATGGQGQGETYTHNLGNGHWQLTYQPAAEAIDSAQVNPIPYAIGFAVLALLGAGAGYGVGLLVQKQKAKKLEKQTSSADRARAMGISPEALNNPVKQQHDIANIQVSQEDARLVGLDAEKPTDATLTAPTASPETADTLLPANVFRSYDIRGVVGPDEINEGFAKLLGQALGSLALTENQQVLLVARDGRLHSESLCDALVDGILSTGCNVINLGAVPTPVLYYGIAEASECSSGVIVTGSHNPAEYNGFKMIINDITLADDAIEDLKLRMQRQDFAVGQGDEITRNLIADYIDRIFSDVALAGDMHIVIDAGNGITSVVAPALFEELGCEVTPLYCEVDGNFPNHSPDPSRAENLQALIAKVQDSGADLGVAFDGDGDRLCVVTPNGEIIWPDRLLMLFAKDIVSRNPGTDVLFDVKSTRQLNSLVSSYGGRPIMARTGHAHMKAKMRETGAMVGGEYSGHIFIKDRWYGFDDGMYAAARLIEIMSLRDQDLDSVFESFPALPVTPEILVPVTDSRKFDIIRQLLEQGEFQSGKITSVDGVRVDFAKGWGLVRASNTSAALTLRFEGETEEVIEQLQKLFKRELQKVAPELQLDFA